jgi:hypothetical protein
MRWTHLARLRNWPTSLCSLQICGRNFTKRLTNRRRCCRLAILPCNVSPEDKQHIDKEAPYGQVKFPGFDSHDAGPHTGIARYIVQDLSYILSLRTTSTQA